MVSVRAKARLELQGREPTTIINPKTETNQAKLGHYALRVGWSHGRLSAAYLRRYTGYVLDLATRIHLARRTKWALGKRDIGLNPPICLTSLVRRIKYRVGTASYRMGFRTYGVYVVISGLCPALIALSLAHESVPSRTERIVAVKTLMSSALSRHQQLR
jgi:hypothetical protein